VTGEPFLLAEKQLFIVQFLVGSRGLGFRSIQPRQTISVLSVSFVPVGSVRVAFF
jgi:hypothetical protein